MHRERERERGGDEKRRRRSRGRESLSFVPFVSCPVCGTSFSAVQLIIGAVQWRVRSYIWGYIQYTRPAAEKARESFSLGKTIAQTFAYLGSLVVSEGGGESIMGLLT